MPDQIDNLTHIERINGVLPALPIKDDAMNDAQFAQLVELLTPGYELSKIVLDQMHARQAAEAAAQVDTSIENQFIEGERKADTATETQPDPAPVPPALTAEPSAPGPIAAPPAPPIIA